MDSRFSNCFLTLSAVYPGERVGTTAVPEKTEARILTALLTTSCRRIEWWLLLCHQHGGDGLTIPAFQQDPLLQMGSTHLVHQDIYFFITWFLDFTVGASHYLSVTHNNCIVIGPPVSAF